jgi:hypothetical protein
MPYVTALIGILTDVKGWILAAIGIVAVVVSCVHGLAYLKGNAMEKQEAAVNIRKTLEFGGGIFFIAWFALYVVTKMSAVSGG